MKRDVMIVVRAVCCLLCGFGAAIAVADQATPRSDAVRVANLSYGVDTQTAVCYSDQFLTQIERETAIKAERKLFPVAAASDALFDYPFVIMSGEEAFTLAEAEQQNLREYLIGGGFIVASAGCSSRAWGQAFEKEFAVMFPHATLETLNAEHPVFHTVYDITESRYKSGKVGLPILKAMVLEGRVALVYSPDGINDSGNAGPKCCCCGGNEVKSAKLLNVNLLAYALSH